MKKLVSVLIALMLCLTAVAAAESVPSKTTDDMTNVSVPSKSTSDMTNINVPTDTAFNVTVPATAESVAACDNEIQKLQGSANVAEYFGEVKNAAGEVVSLTAALGTDTLTVNEFTPLTIENYKEEYGNVVLNLAFATSYTAGDKVLVMIGLVTVAEDATQTVAWTMYEGAVADDGSINVTLEPATLIAIQNGTAVMAIINK